MNAKQILKQLLNEAEERSCEERIDDELAKVINNFERALKGDYPEGEYYEDFLSCLSENSLSFEDVPEGKKLELSTGGPADYFIFHNDGKITYHFLDWGDSAQRTLYGKDYEIMSQVRDMLLEF